MPATSVWLARMEAAMNRSLGESSGAARAAERLEGTSIDIDVLYLARIRAAVASGRLMLITVQPDALQAPAAHRGDAVISGTLLTLLRTALDRGSPQARSELTVTGDAEIAAGYRTLFRLALPDFEEQIARLIGDTPARAVGNFVSGTVGFLRRTRRTVEQNLAEYLQEESRDLVSRTEADEFLHGVDEVRETADRVAARLRQLEQRLKGIG